MKAMLSVQEPVPLLPIPVSPKPRPDPKLSRTIAVAGSVAEPDDFIDLWRGLSSIGSERFALVWETKELIALNATIMDMLVSQAKFPSIFSDEIRNFQAPKLPV